MTRLLFLGNAAKSYCEMRVVRMALREDKYHPSQFERVSIRAYHKAAKQCHHRLIDASCDSEAEGFTFWLQ